MSHERRNMIDVGLIRQYTSPNITAGRSGFVNKGLPDSKRRKSMGKSIVMNSGVVVLAVVMFCGCQILGLGPSDEDLVNATMADWKAALIAHDMDKLMETYSENYANTQGGDKDSVREFIAGVIDQGYLDNVKINLEDAQIKIEGDKADVDPVELTSDGGTYVLDYTLQKEQKAWLIVFSEMQQ